MLIHELALAGEMVRPLIGLLHVQEPVPDRGKYPATRSNDLKPADVLIERFVAWKVTVQQLTGYFQVFSQN